MKPVTFPNNTQHDHLLSFQTWGSLAFLWAGTLPKALNNGEMMLAGIFTAEETLSRVGHSGLL